MDLCLELRLESYLQESRDCNGDSRVKKIYCPFIKISCPIYPYRCCWHCGDFEDCTVEIKCDYIKTHRKKCVGLRCVSKAEIVFEVILRWNQHAEA